MIPLQRVTDQKEAESGVPITEFCRKHGMSHVTFYNWRSNFDGMDAPMMKRMNELGEENRRLKKMYAKERIEA